MAWRKEKDRAGSYEALRSHALRAYDLSLLTTAASYDLNDKAERQRSAADLATFFHHATKALAPKLFIEAGAKDARTSRRARQYLNRARVVAFEANPYTYKTYQGDNPEESGIEYVHLALNDRPGPVTFNVREREDGRPRPDGHGSLMERNPTYEHNFTQVTVEATTLDRFFAGSKFDSCALWIDVEGAAKHVLSGGKRVLEKASILIIEVEDRALWPEAWRKPELERFMYDAGMLPVARDFEYRHQYNMVFVRESLLDHPQLRLRLAEHLSASAAQRRLGPGSGGDPAVAEAGSSTPAGPEAG